MRGGTKIVREDTNIVRGGTKFLRGGSNFVTYIYTVKVEVPCCFFFLCVSFSLLGWLSLHFVLGILLNCGATASY